MASAPTSSETTSALVPAASPAEEMAELLLMRPSQQQPEDGSSEQPDQSSRSKSSKKRPLVNDENAAQEAPLNANVEVSKAGTGDSNVSKASNKRTHAMTASTPLTDLTAEKLNRRSTRRAAAM